MLVIAIIAILAGLLMPALSAARAKAREAACKSNARQSVLALTLYADDFDGHTPSRWNGVYGESLISIDYNSLAPYFAEKQTGDVTTGQLLYHCSEIPTYYGGNPDGKKSQATYVEIHISFLSNLHMFGISGRNFERYASNAVLVCGAGTGIGRDNGYFHVAFPHGVKPITNVFDGNAYKGFCNNSNGEGIANYATASGSVTTVRVNDRDTFIKNNVDKTPVSEGPEMILGLPLHNTSGDVCDNWFCKGA